MKAEAEGLRNRAAPAGSESGSVSDFEEEKVSAKFGSGWSVSTDAVAGGKSKAEMKVASEGAQGSRGSLLITGEVSPDPSRDTRRFRLKAGLRTDFRRNLWITTPILFAN
jgi:hypothetical protein